MASSHLPSQWQARRLYELLEEEQDPFLIGERGHARLFCWFGGSACRILPRLSSLGLKRRLAQWKIIVKKVVTHGCSCWIGNESNGAGFQLLYCSSGLSERANQVVQSHKRNDEEQLSPVSVLDLHPEASYSMKNSSLSSIHKPMTEASQELIARGAEGKRGWHRRKKLLLGCVEEMVGRILVSELSKSVREWSQFKTEIREIGWEIEGAIFDEIREEAVREMINMG